jgi:TPR repeat protein
MKLIIAFIVAITLSQPVYAVDSCDAKADAGKLKGSVKSSFLKKCERTTKEDIAKKNCESKALDNKLKGIAKSNFIKKCFVEGRAKIATDNKAKVAADVSATSEADNKRKAEQDAHAKAQAAIKQKAEAEAKARAVAPATYQLGLKQEESGDFANAMKSYLAAADGGYGLAMKKLSDIYGTGNSFVPRDYALSIKWYHKAKQAGVTTYSIIKR